MDEILKASVALLIAVLAFLPGVPADTLYRRCVGRDWREREWQGLVRVLGFSTAGIILYGLIAYWSGLPLPLPLYALVGSTQPIIVPPEMMARVLVAYAGHFGAATCLGFVSGSVMRRLGRRYSVFTSAWDDFVQLDVPGRWVIVGLKNGAAYAGMLRSADTSARPAERDLVLLEPAAYDEATKTYTSLAHSALFLPAAYIVTIATVHDPAVDAARRVTEVGRPLFAPSVGPNIQAPAAAAAGGGAGGASCRPEPRDAPPEGLKG